MTEPDQKPARKRVSAVDRRRQITEATIACLSQRPPEAWTLRQVARDIGVAPSLITYFFATWGDLLLSAYRLLAERYEAEVAEVEARARDGRRHLEGLINLHLGDDGTRSPSAGVYIAFWAFAQNEPALRREMARFSETAVASIARALEAHARDLGVSRDVRGDARTLYILLDGLWYELAVNPDYIDVAEARIIAWSTIDRMLDG